jgi:ferrochelatase
MSRPEGTGTGAAPRGPLRLLVLGFGGPESEQEVQPFVEGVLAGRGIPATRAVAVIEQYRVVGSRSPYRAEADLLADALGAALHARGWEPDVRLAMRQWRPWLAEVLDGCVGDGWASPDRPTVALFLAPFSGPDAHGRYAAALETALAARNAAGTPAPSFAVVPPWWDLDGLSAAWADALRPAAARGARVLFSAHSVPSAHAEPYREQVQSLARRSAEAALLPESRWELAWQSRSGRPGEPWLEPSADDVLRAWGESLAAAGAAAPGAERDVALAPIGFAVDGVEVQYDLGVRARNISESFGIRVEVLEPPGAASQALVDALAARVESAAGAAP